MTNHSRTKRTRDCKVCYVQHDDEIHEATLRVHQWLSQELTRRLSDESASGGGGEEDTVLDTRVA